MARPALPSDTAVAALRAQLGISQQELAAWLGVSKAQASLLESGQRQLSGANAEALAPLVAVLPAPEPAVSPLRLASAALAAPSMALAPPDTAPLQARIDDCQHLARRLRRLLQPLEQQASQAARWAKLQPALRAALPPDPATEPDPTTAWPAWLVWQRHRWLDRRPTALPPDLSARYHLLRLRAEALEAEAAGLAALLAP